MYTKFSAAESANALSSLLTKMCSAPSISDVATFGARFWELYLSLWIFKFHGFTTWGCKKYVVQTILFYLQELTIWTN